MGNSKSGSEGIGGNYSGMSDSDGSMTGTSTSVPRIGRRGMSPTVAVVILVVVVLIAAGAGYFGLQSVKSSKASSTTCTPSTACASAANDVNVFVAQQPGYGQQYAQLSALQAFSGTVIPTGSETVKTYSINWGDGSSSSSSSPILTHQYGSAGLYVMSGSAIDTGGVTHTGTAGLFPVNVNLSFGNFSFGTYPSISTSFSNGTTGGYEPWVAVGTTVSVSAAYVGTPSTPGWSNGPMTITSGSGVVQKSYTPGAQSASGSYTLTSTGTANITLHGSSTNGVISNPITYTWAVYVAPSASGIGCKYCSPPTSSSPHSGSLVVYEVAPGGAVTLDPAGDYYTVGDEVSLNIFQDLIAYNGTDVGPSYPNYVPQIATCVPGSPECTTLYGSNLTSGHMVTFVIAKTAKFYDPTTKSSWNVYPSDVMFSYARQLAFADLPAVAVYPGWIEAQALLPTGNPSWDGGIHAPYNNTPQNIMNAMLVNDSAYCPASAISGSSGNGCITFNVSGAGVGWPAFLSYVAHGTGGNIVPAGWYISNGATVPGFTTTGADSPVLLPGGVTSTSDSAYQTWLSQQTPTSWDSYEELAVSDYPTLESGVAFNEVGSGPYALTSANAAIGYVLQANPDFQAPAGCAGQSWCEPAYGSYAKTVTVYWGDDDTAGIEAAQAGQADIIDYEAADTATVLALVQKGDLKLTIAPATTEFNFGYNMEIDLTSLKTYDPYPVNIQSNSLSYVGLRGFLDAAYPSASVQAQFNQIEGIQYGFNFGGFIPEYMGDYYPTNLSWPNYNVATGLFSDPVAGSTTVGSASWYWTQITTPGNALFDSQLAGSSAIYSKSNPLHVPALYFLGDPTHQSVLNLWSSEVSALSGGEVVFDVFPVSSAIVYANLLPDGECPWALWFLGWAADYAQPYDYWAAYGAGSGTWSAADTLYPVFTGSAYNSPSCVSGDGWSVLTYWASQSYIPQDCQGAAYQATLYWATYANTNLNLAQGTVEWNQISAVYNLLNLYCNTEQSNAVLTTAPWINPASVNANSLNGFPGGELVFWSVTGNGVA